MVRACDEEEGRCPSDEVHHCERLAVIGLRRDRCRLRKELGRYKQTRHNTSHQGHNPRQESMDVEDYGRRLVRGRAIFLFFFWESMVLVQRTLSAPILLISIIIILLLPYSSVLLLQYFFNLIIFTIFAVNTFLFCIYSCIFYTCFENAFLESGVYRKQPLYFTQVRDKVCLHPPFQDPTCGITLSMLLLYSGWSFEMYAIKLN